MKYCSKCGNQLFDEAVICPQCGCATGYQEHTIRKQTSTMQTVAKIFMIIGTVVSGFAIIPLAWCVPMTLSYINKIKNGGFHYSSASATCIITAHSIRFLNNSQPYSYIPFILPVA